MKDALVVDANDIKAILAEKFNVPESNIIKSQYSYTVILNRDHKNEETKD
jgi:hypothetical protein